MNKKRALIMTALLAVLTTFIGFFYISSVKEEAAKEAEVEKIELVIASSTIPAYVQVTEEMLEMKEFSEEFASASAVKTFEEAIGLMTNAELIAGEPILSERLISNEADSLLSYRIPATMRAVTIPVNEIIGLAGYVVPGDYVDMLVTYVQEVEEADEETEEDLTDEKTQVYTQMQNIEVLATGSYNPVLENKELIPSSLTLLVSPAQAEVVAYANQKGSVYLTLRNPSDSEKEELEGYGDTNFDNWKER